MPELVQVLAGWWVGSLITGVMLVLDRRRLDAYGKARMWNQVTLVLAVSGLFLPAPLTFGAHVWVTRRPPLWRRLGLALLGVLLALVLSTLGVELVLSIYDWLFA